MLHMLLSRHEGEMVSLVVIHYSTPLYTFGSYTSFPHYIHVSLIQSQYGTQSSPPTLNCCWLYSDFPSIRQKASLKLTKLVPSNLSNCCVLSSSSSQINDDDFVPFSSRLVSIHNFAQLSMHISFRHDSSSKC